ncbi:sensor histidine kinase [Clostridium sp. SHJSY1]|uniref:sensor histidine kinase n=1 Tax=Clostridium sp. SHJSY1 TaxID=2942483 RepID=UPI0028756C76|nr:sensor histidine kinase [Clostridium sp. SHJSY1]MDS0527752.1 sensor histidine kinase [Clostridium sp. SHJSY1]
MNKEVIYNKYILILKYIYIALFIACAIIYKINIIDYKFAILLIYIANNQFRYFRLGDKRELRYISILVDMVCAFSLYSLIGGFGSIIFLPILVDIIYEFENIFAFIYLVFTFILVGLTNSIEQLIYFAVETSSIIFLGMIIREQSQKKLKAQKLYDRIRENEEELKKLNYELESYANTVEEIAVLRERNRISREIHDNVGHSLSTIRIQLGAIGKISSEKCEPAAEMCNNLAEFTKKSLEDVRDAVRAMKPREFEEYEGIIIISEMIKNFKKLTDIDVKLRVSEKVWKLNSDQSMAIYRIIQEFLSNSLKHGKATKVNIFLNFLDESLRIHLKDNGVGCSDVKTGIGLQSIKERTAFYGGTMEYKTQEGKGFELAIVMNKTKLSIDGV